MKCKCGSDLKVSVCNDIEIEDDTLIIDKLMICDNCSKTYSYNEIHLLDFDNPFDVTLKEIKM